MILDMERVGKWWMWCCHAAEVWCQKASKELRRKSYGASRWHIKGWPHFIVSIRFAASSRNTTRWISLAFLIDMFSSSSSSSSPVFHLLFFSSSPHQDEGFYKKKLSHPRTPPRTRHLFTLENEVCDESQLFSEKIGCRQSPHFPPSSW